MTEPSEISEYGWTFHDRCNCSGQLKVKYRHPVMRNLELEHWPRQKAFKITYLGSSTKVPATSTEKLKQILENVHQTEVTT